MKAETVKVQNRGEAKIFDNPFLESLSKTDLPQNIVIYGATVAILSYVAIGVKGIPVLTFVGIFTFAIISWTFAEYLMHRYLFHWWSESKIVQRFHYIVHGSHHEYPRDKGRLLMPPVPGLLIGSVLFGIFYILFTILGISVYTWAYFPGFFLGYLLYSILHRATHMHKPPKRFKYLWTHHSLHHYKYPDKCFGVSNLFWDKVFGTMPPKEDWHLYKK